MSDPRSWVERSVGALISLLAGYASVVSSVAAFIVSVSPLPLAWAQSAANPPPVAVEANATRSISELKAAQILMLKGRIAEAKRVLVALEHGNPNDKEVQFLLGMIAVAEKDYGEAIRRFRDILDHEPAAARVRLELARAFFLNADYDNAERQFRLARAGDLPADVKVNIDQYLATIRRVRQWSHNVSIAAVPDTNINAGPTVSTVGLYGLPFELSQNARQQSGIGVKVDAGGEWSPPLSDDTQLRLGAQFTGLDYPSNGAFNDMTVAAYAGPRFFSGRWEISPLVTAFERWYGNRFYNDGVGASLQTVYYSRSDLALNGVIGAQQVTYGPPAGQSGPAVSGTLGLFYALNPSSTISGTVSATRQNAAQSDYSYTAGQVQVGYDRDLAGGWSTSPRLSYAMVDYDNALAAFGVARHDRVLIAEIAIVNRRIDIYGFTPRLAYTLTLNQSNISLYRYDRNQLEIGLTRSF